MGIAQFWEVLTEFPKDLIQAKLENEKAAARQLKVQKELERRQAMKAKRVKNKQRKEKGVFERYKEERAGDVDDIVARFKKNKEQNSQRGRGSRSRRTSQFRKRRKGDLRVGGRKKSPSASSISPQHTTPRSIAKTVDRR